MNNEGVRSTKRMSDTGDSGMSAYFSSKGSQLSKANPKNVYLPESTPEEKAKIQSDRLAVKGGLQRQLLTKRQLRKEQMLIVSPLHVTLKAILA